MKTTVKLRHSSHRTICLKQGESGTEEWTVISHAMGSYV